MHPFDIFITLLFLIFSLIGILQGLWKIITGWFSLFFSIIIAINFSQTLALLLPLEFPFKVILIFIILFIFSLFLLSLLRKAGEKVIKSSGLKGLDRFLGFILLFILSLLLSLAIIHIIFFLGFENSIEKAAIPDILLKIEEKIIELIKQ